MREASADLVRVSKFKELDRKREKGRENGGVQPPVFANVQFPYFINSCLPAKRQNGFILSLHTLTSRPRIGGQSI